MIKRNIPIVVLLFLAVSAGFGVIAQILTTELDDTNVLMEARTVKGRDYSTKDIPIELVFRNPNEKEVRLLDIFDDEKAKQIFFTIELRDSNGTPLSTVGGGKIAFSRDSMKYVVLRKDAEFSVLLNIKDFLVSATSLKPDNYSVSITYRNSYGEDCFKGSIESNILSLNLADEPQV